MLQSEAGYILYVVFLFLATGACILLIDATRYKKAELRREGKFSFFLGWGNIVAGVSLWGGNWAYSTFFA